MGTDPEAAARLVRDVEAAAETAALSELHRCVRDWGHRDDDVLGVAVVVKPVSVPGEVAAVLRSHAWMHAAEGALYRDAVLAAASRFGWRAHAVEQARQPPADPRLAGLREAAGPPWRRIEKEAATAALSLLG